MRIKICMNWQICATTNIYRYSHVRMYVSEVLRMRKVVAERRNTL